MVSSQLLLRKRSRRCMFQLRQQHCRAAQRNAQPCHTEVQPPWYAARLAGVLTITVSCKAHVVSPTSCLCSRYTLNGLAIGGAAKSYTLTLPSPEAASTTFSFSSLHAQSYSPSAVSNTAVSTSPAGVSCRTECQAQFDSRMRQSIHQPTCCETGMSSMCTQESGAAPTLTSAGTALG